MNYRIRLQNELEHRVQTNGLKWFTPNGRQEECIQAVGSGDYFIIIFSAANGVGKTALMANILGSVIFGNPENPYFDYPIFKNFQYPRRGRIASTTKNVEEVGAIQTEIKRWFPQGKYECKKNQKRYDSEFIAGDWVFDVMTYEQDVTEYESATLGLMIFDEPPPIKILWATIARMRKGGIILMFMTPLDNGGDIIEDLQTKAENSTQELGKVKLIYAEIEDNCKEHGVRGKLEHKHIEQMLQFYDADERDARAKGKPSHLVGRIYPDFEDRDPYIVDEFEIPAAWNRIQLIDPHDAIPFAVSWAAVDPTGQVWIYDEFPFEDLERITSTSLTYPDYARIIREREQRDTVSLRIIDPFFGNKRYAVDGRTPKEELERFGFDFENGDTSGIDMGHKRVREFLKYDKTKPVSSLNHPKLHILKKCRNHWRSMLRYKRKLLKSGEVKDKIVIEETYKHFCDNIRHLLMREDLTSLKNTNSFQIKRPTFSGAGGY